MAGTANPPAGTDPQNAGESALYVVQATGTTNDGKTVPAFRLIGDDGLPVGAAKPLSVSAAAGNVLSATLLNAVATTGAGPAFTVTGMASAFLTVSGTFVGTVQFEGTEDGTRWLPILGEQQGTANVAATDSISGNNLFQVSVSGLTAIRANVTAYTSGAITVTAHASPIAYAPKTVAMQFPFKLAGEDTTVDVMKVEQRYTNFNISTATTTTVKATSGYLDSLFCAGGTLGNVTVYDNTAGSGSLLLPTVTPLQGQKLLEHCTFSNGLTIVTAAATVLTGGYR